MSRTRSSSPHRFFSFGLALTILVYLLFNASLTVHRWLVGDGWWFAVVPAIETTIIIWGALAVAQLRGTVRRIILAFSGSLYGTLVLFSSAEALFQFIYARPFVPRADIPMVRGGLLLVLGQIGDLVNVLTPVAISLILATAWLFGIGLMTISSAGIQKQGNHLTAVVTVTLISLTMLVVTQPGATISATVVSGITAGRPVEFIDAMSQPFTIDEQRLETGSDASDYALPGIRDRDIYVFAVEAYGYTTFSRDDLYDQLETDFHRLGDVLANAGYGVVSNYLLAPVAGGFSWLSEATFLTGQWINSQPVFEQLYDSPVSTLPGFLYDEGYHTLAVKPGTVHGSWPEGWDLFGFEESLIAYDGDFDYHGPWFSFVPITDQFAVHAGHQYLLQARSEGGSAENRPVFSYFQLVSSHTPFNRIPPYLEDWDRLGNGTVYHELKDQILTYDNTWTGGSQLDEGFVASISYVFTVLSEYFGRFLDHSRDPIIIVFGDHQPQRPIREPNAHLSVPIHIASRDQEILDRFRSLGFTDGIHGKQEPPHSPMSEFFSMFVEVARP